MKLASGVVDQYIYIAAVDSTDHVSPKTGLSSFTAYRSRNGGTATAYTTPTITEVDATNMPGLYKFLIDEDTTIDSGDETQEYAVTVKATGMDNIHRVIELFRPKITVGNTLDVTATGAAGVDWGNVENKTTTNDLSATTIATSQAIASVSGAVGSVTGAVGSVTGNVGGNVTGSIGSLGAQAKLDVNAEADTALVDYDAPTNAEMVAAFTEIKGATWASTDTLEAIRDRGDAAWTTATGFATPTNVSDVQTHGDLAWATATGFSTFNPTTDTVAHVTLVDTTTTNTDMVAAAPTASQNAAAVLTTQMTESYAANGVAPTLAQAQFAIHQMLMDFGISGTSLTVKKLDNSTTAFIVTLNDATDPTGAARA